MKLLLWDIDGTLIRSHGRSLEAFKAAFQRVYEVDLPLSSTAGKTDGLIVRETLHSWEEAAILERLEQFYAVYEGELQARFEYLQRETTILHGVHSALSHLQPHTIQSLLTGNLQRTAKIKLDAVDLSRHFRWEWGAFGSDSHIRNDLVPVALQRAQAAGWHGTFDDVVVIGDTPFDIACAKIAGACSVAVASGKFSREQLSEHQPDLLLENLGELAQLQAFLGVADEIAR
ncbi:MAG TPA: hydrolase [Herpetosiphon sp.]|uniref:Haloacid dehalogenase domain protein hydrolase n=1 Tax=Herpetosiphon aurantiacus (strain ATCC 23779 / DSM 785 / 114-95) TaxID=316274 RepID=A9AVL5_HERA2|nr:haloacid dehalogenase-like hydrolase [Herpetosiphon sp.]ABX06615.1 Haloacid dehalogenase domain protein hydrolase [Herpetosiphon aurantiacus DSM 785]HBW49280.1 hydrolase [Herpetosiphon sp.]